MCVFVCVCVCVCVKTQKPARAHGMSKNSTAPLFVISAYALHAFLCNYTQTLTYIYEYIYIPYRYLRKLVLHTQRVCPEPCASICKLAYICICIHMGIHTHTLIHIHIYTCASSCCTHSASVSRDCNCASS